MLGLALLAAPAPAQACEDDVQGAQRYLELLQGKSDQVREGNRERVRKLLADAARTIAQAREQCAAAKGFGDRAVAVGTVAGARAQLVAAEALIVAD